MEGALQPRQAPPARSRTDPPSTAAQFKHWSFQMTTTLPAVTEPLRLYTTHLLYVATGAGLRQEALLLMASSDAEARARHLDTFYPGDLPSQQYFSVGVDVFPGIHAPSLQGLNPDILSSLEQMITGGGRFLMRWSFNAG